jgi:hypothetical protein
MQEKEADREARLREVASKLFFTLKNQGLRFSLYRDVDVPEPIRHDGLSLDEVEDILNIWKLRGPHGGLMLHGPVAGTPLRRSPGSSFVL